MKGTFICLDCETTGLDPKLDRIIEIALMRFDFHTTLHSYETLIDPEIPISQVSMAIHHITEEMVREKPKIQEVLPTVLEWINHHIVIGHGIKLDLAFLVESAKRFQIPHTLDQVVTIDTLRLARLYGESPTNSLERLRQHFNIEPEGAHRAMSDVTVNIAVFKHLCVSFKSIDELLQRLKKPILLKTMPLGKYKGRPFPEVPLEYLLWAVKGDFDQDLIYSLQTELQKRRKGGRFSEASNPFATLE